MRPLLVLLVPVLALSACKKGKLPDLPAKIVGSCVYTNAFSRREECRDYMGDWSDAAATKDCADQSSTIALGKSCAYSARLGYCVLGGKNDLYTRVLFPGDDKSKCGGSKTGCELFGGGIFDASPVCGGVKGSVDLGLPVFQQPVRNCIDAKAGEPPGQSEGGKVCTQVMISGATELGRDFADYADCNAVRTQRPYHAAPTEKDAEQDDPRLQDPTYAAELAWVKTQVKSAACVCCHSNTAPLGPSNWYLESPGNFMNSFYGSGLAMGAGWINSVGFGAFPKEQNNGFSRAAPDRPNDSIFPSTDPARMATFFEQELAHRNLTRADFADQRYAAGPLDEQRFFRPRACENGDGIDASGALIWSNGDARYVYVLGADADSPTVPPNLDLPTGTIWRIDVPVTGTPVASGSVYYGTLPDGMRQRYPKSGAPAALQSGSTYYLYVLGDIAVPATRCLFTAP